MHPMLVVLVMLICEPLDCCLPHSIFEHAIAAEAELLKTRSTPAGVVQGRLLFVVVVQAGCDVVLLFLLNSNTSALFSAQR